MVILLTIIHVFVCLFLVVVVLLQSGKAADLAGAFGGMGSQTAFGPRGTATLLSRWTTFAAGMFMVTSLSLALLQTRNSGGGSVTDRVKSAAPAKVQNAPAPAGVPALPGNNPVPMPGGLPSVKTVDGSNGAGAQITFPANAGKPPAAAPVPVVPPKK
jgi:preprotein translocase subunit SecG